MDSMNNHTDKRYVYKMDKLNANVSCQHKIDNEDTFNINYYHNHDGYELYLFLHGDINYYIEQEGRHLVHGDLVCIRTYDFHKKDQSQIFPYERIVIDITEDEMAHLSSEATDLSACFSRKPHGVINVLQLTNEETSQYILYAHHLHDALASDEYGSDILAEAYLKQLLVMVNRHSDSSHSQTSDNLMPPIVTKTMAFIEEHITEDINMDILAAAIHHNKSYIGRCFKNITGLTLQQFIINKRVTLAKKLLRDGQSPTDVCFLSGFNDYSNFSRTFTKYANVSPRQYKNRKGDV